MAASWRIFHHDGKISPAWWGWWVHFHLLSLHLSSRTKLQCTLQLREQIHSPLCTVCPILYNVPYILLCTILFAVPCTLYSALYTKQCTVQRVCTELNRLSGGKNRRIRSNNFSFLFHFTLKGYTFMRLAGIGACCWESLLFSGRINWAFLWRLILLSRANSSLKSIREKFCSV
jgi:hypothetical protein